MSYEYTTVGNHVYDVRVNDNVSYNFTVSVVEPPGCTPVNGNSLKIVGASTLASPGTAVYSVLVNESCFNLQEVRAWRVLDSNGAEVLDGSPIANLENNSFQFSFLRTGTFRIEADVRVSQSGEVQTLFIPVTVGGAVNCNPTEFEIRSDTEEIPGRVNFTLDLPDCFDASNVSHYTWDFNYDGQNSQIDYDSYATVYPKSTSASFHYKNTDGMIRYGAYMIYASRIRVNIHYERENTVTLVDRRVRFKQNDNSCAINSGNISFELGVNKPADYMRETILTLPDVLRESEANIVYRVYNKVNNTFVLKEEIKAENLPNKLVLDYEFTFADGKGNKQIEAIVSYSLPQGPNALNCPVTIVKRLNFTVTQAPEPVIDVSCKDPKGYSCFRNSDRGPAGEVCCKAILPTACVQEACQASATTD